MINNQPLISVIIPIYNDEKYLSKCVDSVLAQSYKNLEIILIDDGSTDSSSQICDTYKENDPRIIVIHQENSGVSVARNTGIDKSSGEYITFIDHDDWIDPNMYQILLNQCIEFNLDFAKCTFYEAFADGSRTPERLHFIKPNFLYTENIIDLYFKEDTGFPVVVWNGLYKKEFVDQFRYPKGLLAEDNYMSGLYFFHAKRVMFIDEPLYFFYCNPLSQSREKSNIANIHRNILICLDLLLVHFNDNNAKPSIIKDLHKRKALFIYRDIRDGFITEISSSLLIYLLKYLNPRRKVSCISRYLKTKLLN